MANQPGNRGYLVEERSLPIRAREVSILRPIVDLPLPWSAPGSVRSAVDLDP